MPIDSDSPGSPSTAVEANVAAVNDLVPPSSSIIKAASTTELETTIEADQSSNASVAEHVKLIAQLYNLKERLEAEINSKPGYSAHSRYRSVDFCWTAMKLVSQLPSGSAQGVEYIKSKIWAKHSEEVDIAACETFEEMIFEFCTGIVQSRYDVYDDYLASSIFELAQNRCVVSQTQEIHLAESPSSKWKYELCDYKLLTIVSLVPQLSLDFWDFASNIMGDKSLKCYGEGRPPLKANDFLVLQVAVASEFNKFKIAIGTEKISNEDGCFRKVERNLHLDVYTPFDDVLDSLPSLIEDSSVNQYNQSLLNLHLFLHRLFDQSDLGPRWLQTPYWNDRGVLSELPVLDKLGRNLEEFMQKQENDYLAEEDAHERNIEEFNGWAPGDTHGVVQHAKENAEAYKQMMVDPGCPNDGLVFK